MFNKAELARCYGCDSRTIDIYLKIQPCDLTFDLKLIPDFKYR